MRMHITTTAFAAITMTLVSISPAVAETGAEAERAEVTSVMRGGRPPVYRPAPRIRPVPVRRAPVRVYAVPAYAPRPRAAIEPFYMPEVYFGFGLNGTSVLGADNSRMTAGLDSGAGFELATGWRASDDLSIDLSMNFSFHDALAEQAGPGAMLGHVGLDFRYFLGDWTRALQPYLQFGLGGYFLGRGNWDFDTLGGLGLQLGAGVDFYLSRSVSLGAKVLYRGAYLDNSSSTWSGFPTESMWLSAVTYGGDIKFHF